MEALWRKVPAGSRCSVACDLDRIGWRAGADVDPEQAWFRTRPRGNGNGRRRELKIEWQRYDSLHMLGGCVIWLMAYPAGLNLTCDQVTPENWGPDWDVVRRDVGELEAGSWEGRKLENWGGISVYVGVFLYLCSFGTRLNEDKHKAGAGWCAESTWYFVEWFVRSTSLTG